MQRYLAGQQLNERELRVLFGTSGEDILPAKDRALLDLWKSNLDPLAESGYKDPKLAARLQPEVTRIVDSLIQPQPGSPAPAPGGERTITMREVEAIAAAERKPVEAVLAEVRRQGYTVTGAPSQRPGGRPSGQAAPSPVQMPPPSARMGTFLAQWRRTKKPIAKKVWESLTQRERDWLTLQGVKAER
jgi:hypothetical protein